ncbi:MAG: DUF2244 domain-containing protein [Pseudomonadota bacterium]
MPSACGAATAEPRHACYSAFTEGALRRYSPLMESGPHTFNLQANCALSAGQAVAFFAGIAAVSLGIALLFVARGYWPVLPFAGAELAFLAWALRASWRAGQAREQLVIDSDEIVITRWDPDADAPSTTRLPRTWTKAALIEVRDRRGGEQLALGQRGRWWVIGRFLGDDERKRLHHRLSQVLRQNGHIGPR